MDYPQSQSRSDYQSAREQNIAGGSGVVGYAGNTAPQVAPITIGDEIARLEQALASLHQTCEVLEKRLNPILAATPPEPSGESAGNDRIGLSPVTAQLRNLQRAVNAADSRLGRILNRIEL